MTGPSLDPILAAIVNGANPQGEPRHGHCAACGQDIEQHDPDIHVERIKRSQSQETTMHPPTASRAFSMFALAGILAALVIACSNTCSSGSVCGDGNIVGPGALPSPSPAAASPTPGSTPDPCRVESITVAFHSGAQLPSVAVGAGNEQQLDATPRNSQGIVPDGCNLSRTPTWSVATPAVCQILGGGYNPFLRGLAVGTCSLSASMVWGSQTITSPPFVVAVR